MYLTMNSALAEEHVRDMRAQAESHKRVLQARQARREQQRTRHSLVAHEVPARRRQAAARHA